VVYFCPLLIIITPLMDGDGEWWMEERKEIENNEEMIVK
jgi:hypothetical protein